MRIAIALGCCIVVAGCSVQGAVDPESSSPEHWVRAHEVKQCMSEAGWQMELNAGDGSLTAPSLPDSQVVPFQEAFDSCLKRFPLPPLVVSEENASRYYDELITARNCLAELGYSGQEPPSKQASVESMLNGNGIIDPLWDPYEPLFTAGLDETTVTRALIACPQPEWGVPSSDG